jgi:predicted Fe-Mo cluster-binding NifX family protein
VKIAVASEDGISISHHFGRSRCFLVFETQDKQVTGQSLRENTFTAHARGECREGEPHEHHHGHGPIVEALGDCEVVLCYGMGWRAAEDLKQNGIQAFVLQGEMTPEQAVQEFLAGRVTSAGGFCRCHG